MLRRGFASSLFAVGLLLASPALWAQGSTSSDPRYPKRPCPNPNENYCGEGSDGGTKPYDPAEGARQIQELTKELIEQINRNGSSYGASTGTDASTPSSAPSYGSDHSERKAESYGFDLLYRKKWKEAEREFQRLLAIKPDYHQFVHGYADALGGQKRWVEAEAAYQRAISLRYQGMPEYERRDRLFLKSELGALYIELNEVRRRQKKPPVQLDERPWEGSPAAAIRPDAGATRPPIQPPTPEPRMPDPDGLTDSWIERRGDFWMIYVRNTSAGLIRILWGNVYDCVEVGLGCGSTASGIVLKPGVTATLATVSRATCTNAFDEAGREIDRCSGRPDTHFKYEYRVQPLPTVSADLRSR